MQYDVIDAPRGQTYFSYNRSYQRRVDPPAAPVLQGEVDEDSGETIYRPVPQLVSPQPDSHYVVCRNQDEEVAWQIYAGPFDVNTAVEIATALQIVANAKKNNVVLTELK